MLTAPLILYENGRIWTGDSELPWAESLAVANGRLLAVGSRDELGWVARRADRVVDLGGNLVLPGFNDAHVHAYEGGKSLLEIDLRSVKSLEDLKQRVKEHSVSLREGEWLTGGNWDHQNWGGHPYPDRHVLDEAAGCRPVLLFRVDWHVAVANTAALRAAGIRRDTPDPPGGEIERDEHGEPTGILKDTAAELVLARAPEPDDARLEEIFLAATGEATRLGVTSLQDNVTPKHFRIYQKLARERKLPARVSCWFPLSNLDDLVDLGIQRNLGGSRLDLGTVKLFADGSLGAGTAYFFEPYADRPDYRGLLLMSREELREALSRISQAGLQAAVHAIGDAANALVLDLFEELGVAESERPRIEHAQTLRDEDVQRMARLGVVASIQPVHAMDDLRWAREKIGERVQQSYRLRSLLEAGVRVAMGTDWPVASLNPMLGLEAASFRHLRLKEDAPLTAEASASEMISVEEAVRLYTLGSAYVQDRDGVKGTLTPGKFADFVVLDRDVFTCEPEELRHT
ncbi:MAG TPA: amidohydrolase, partial [Bacteroidetes bacterium]|nr:amidohydrolase [Bacteroidota bacterium]